MKKNIIANFVGRAWGVIANLLFIPLYLKLLGIESFGLVGFYSTLMGVLAFADMGFTATLNREIARLSVCNDSEKEMNDVLRTYETAYICISLVLAGIIWFAAPQIAENWLRYKILKPNEITLSIRLMGIAVAIQMSSGLYIGGLLGLQKQILSNSLQISWGLFRGAGAVFVLVLVNTTIIAFVLWQLISNVFYCLVARIFLRRALSSDRVHPKFQWNVLRNTWRYAAGMTGLAVISTLLTQTDKLIVSKMMSLEYFGYFTLASTLAAVPLMLAGPIATAVFPRFTGLVVLKDQKNLYLLYHKICALVAVAVIPGCLTLVFFANDFIFAWTGSILAAKQAGFLASLLLGGQLMQAIAIVPFYIALAHGNTKLYIYTGIVSVVIIIPLLIILIRNYGGMGAGISWVVLGLLTMPISTYFLHRQHLPGEIKRWWILDVGRPFFAAIPGVLLGRCLIHHNSSRILSFIVIGLVWSISTISAAFSISDFRMLIKIRAKRIFGVSIVK